MTNDDLLFRHRLLLFAKAAEVGVSRACREHAKRIDSVGAECVVVLDGSAYFNRPGPRLVDSLELPVANR